MIKIAIAMLMPFLFSSAPLYADNQCFYDSGQNAFVVSHDKKIIIAPGKHVESSLANGFIQAITSLGTRAANVSKVNYDAQLFLKESSGIPAEIGHQLDLYHHNAPLSWIGVEQSNFELVFGNLRLLDFKTVDESLANAKVSSDDRNKIGWLLLGPVFYLLYENGEELGRQAETQAIVGLENDKVKEELSKIVYPSLNAIVAEFDAAQSRGDLSQFQADALLATWSYALAKRLPPTEEKRQELLTSVSEARTQKAIGKLFRLIDIFLDSTDVRDFYMAKNALDQKGNGIIFVGSKHADEKDPGKGLVYMMTKICNGDKTPPPMPEFNIP